MKKFKSLFFIINILTAIIPISSIYSNDNNLKIREEVISFQKHPFIYSNTVTALMCSIDKCLTTESSDPTDFINNLSQLLSDYIYMISHQNNLESGNEIIQLLEGEIRKLNATQELITDLKQQSEFFEQDQKTVMSMACFKIMRILKRYKLKKIFKKAHKILETSYNQAKGKPLSYQELFLKAELFGGADKKEGYQILNFFSQIIESQDAGLIRFSESVEYKHEKLGGYLTISESSQEGAESFTIDFDLQRRSTP